MTKKESPQPNIWRGEVGYSILTPSFADSNGDGIGDLEGIQQKLGYLSYLGVDAIHLTPFYKTHAYDIGYDVDDYREIDPRYGNFESIQNLITDAHTNGLKVVTDLVINHTTIHHPWFEESVSSRNNPKRNWYIWRDVKPNGENPNNWVGNFGGSAWEFDNRTDQSYLHTFLPEQPDLNWQNPEVRQAMFDVMRFWADLGVDGFRLDSLPFIAKANGLPDADENPDYHHGITHPSKRVLNNNWWFQKDLLTYLKEFADVIENEYPGKFLFSESNPPEDLKEWRPRLYQAASGNAHAIINSTLVGNPWNADAVMDHLEEFYDMLRPEDIAMLQVSNHDVTNRLVDKLTLSHPDNAPEQARNAGLMLLTLPGMPWLYYGDEMGVRGRDVPYDPDNTLLNHTFRRFGYNKTKDPARLPMPWNGDVFGGFSSTKPWSPLPPYHQANNVASQIIDPQSELQLYRRLIRLRRSSDTLQNGSFQRLDAYNPSVGAYTLHNDSEEQTGVIINFTNEVQQISLDYKLVRRVLTGSLDTSPGEILDLRQYSLRPNESIIFQK